jgi:hypothetical protein
MSDEISKLQSIIMYDKKRIQRLRQLIVDAEKTLIDFQTQLALLEHGEDAVWIGFRIGNTPYFYNKNGEHFANRWDSEIFSRNDVAEFMAGWNRDKWYSCFFYSVKTGEQVHIPKPPDFKHA